MPLPPADTQRTSRHGRSTRIEAYERDEGSESLDARLTGIQSEPVTGIRPVGATAPDFQRIED